MKLLEACAGENQSWSKAGRALGFECTTLDYNTQIPGIDLYEDVRTFEPTEEYDVVCCSPDCREISRARSKKGDQAYADEVGEACVRLCLRAAARGGVDILENPQGALERRPFMQQYEGKNIKLTIACGRASARLATCPAQPGSNFWETGSRCVNEQISGSSVPIAGYRPDPFVADAPRAAGR